MEHAQVVPANVLGQQVREPIQIARIPCVQQVFNECDSLSPVGHGWSGSVAARSGVTRVKRQRS
jgi:hypothetical protein